jgi:hypothetical protein
MSIRLEKPPLHERQAVQLQTWITDFQNNRFHTKHPAAETTNSRASKASKATNRGPRLFIFHHHERAIRRLVIVGLYDPQKSGIRIAPDARPQLPLIRRSRHRERLLRDRQNDRFPLLTMGSDRDELPHLGTPDRLRSLALWLPKKTVRTFRSRLRYAVGNADLRATEPLTIAPKKNEQQQNKKIPFHSIDLRRRSFATPSGPRQSPEEPTEHGSLSNE